MSLRKEFKNFKDLILSAIENNRQSILCSQRREINKDDNIRSLDSCNLIHAKSISEIQQQLQKLQQQVQCGVRGHNFQLTNALPNFCKTEKTLGMFKCKTCRIILNRELTQKENESAKKLGFLK